MLIFDFENVLKIYLEHVSNMPLFSSIFKNILLLEMFPKIYNEWPPNAFLIFFAIDEGFKT